MLDEKIKQQSHLTTCNEDFNEAKAFAARNREELIKLRIRLSTLITTEEKMTVDLKILLKDNEFFLKQNADYEIENAKL